jgi:hypothetical protein
MLGDHGLLEAILLGMRCLDASKLNKLAKHPH